MAFRKGQPKVPGSGRRKGVKNKVTRNVEALIWEAVELAGGAEALSKQPGILFGQLLPKLLPQKVTQKVDATHREVHPDPERGLLLLRQCAQAAAEKEKEAELFGRVVSIPGPDASGPGGPGERGRE